MYIQCMKDNECYDRYITGNLLNPKQKIPVSSNVEIIPSSEVLVCVYPLEDTEVKWKDSVGDLHVSRLHKGQGVAVSRKFLVKECSVGA